MKSIGKAGKIILIGLFVSSRAWTQCSVSIGKTYDTGIRLNLKDNYDSQLKLMNTDEEGASKRIGATGSDWVAGGGKLVFTPTSGSSAAALLPDDASNKGAVSNPGVVKE